MYILLYFLKAEIPCLKSVKLLLRLDSKRVGRRAFKIYKMKNLKRFESCECILNLSNLLLNLRSVSDKFMFFAKFITPEIL